ncbi:MAG: hypothetical protein HKN99_12960 [Winogradskyella sp.]|nr:hypothetical protein [Winogradskyella sp.]NNF85413.1 hypothetical protein [Winogradskyella sp.]
MRYTLFFLIAFGQTTLYSQSISSEAVLQKAIDFHDPNGNWKTFNNAFTVEMTTPNASKRTSNISINLPAQYFKVEATRDTVTTVYEVYKDKCSMTYNSVVLDSAMAKSKNMSCERAEMYKNYYTYLYGLPMKLEDPGTDINYPVEKRVFKDKTYLVLKVTYTEAVGSDVWYFYFDPKSYEMQVYQFFKTDDRGNLISDSGEYILLTGSEEISNIKMPKIRAWYYNKDDKYLGTDTLLK